MRKPIAPSLAEPNPNAPADPARALHERTRNAIESRVAAKDWAAVERAGVDGAATPPKPKATPNTSNASGSASDATSTNSSPKDAAAKAQPSTEAGSTPSASSETPESSGKPAEESESSAATQRGPRYDVKSMKKWVEQHPEEAAELRVHVFGADQDATQEWVKVQNKKRKMKEELRAEKEKTAAETAAERAQAKADRDAAEQAARALTPVVDLWQGATRKDANGNAFPDFDLVDAAFEQTAKMPLDQYMRLRARRGVSNPEGAKMRAENARLTRELEALKTNGAAAASAPAAGSGAPDPVKPAAAAPAAPKVDFEEKWGDELPKTHKLRNITDWASKLDAEMSKYHDEELDEYSRDPEEVADRVLKRELAALADEDDEPEAPAARKTAKPVTPKRKVAAKAAETDEEEGPAGFAERERWALERARKRMMESRG